MLFLRLIFIPFFGYSSSDGFPGEAVTFFFFPLFLFLPPRCLFSSFQKCPLKRFSLPHSRGAPSFYFTNDPKGGPPPSFFGAPPQTPSESHPLATARSERAMLNAHSFHDVIIFVPVFFFLSIFASLCVHQGHDPLYGNSRRRS